MKDYEIVVENFSSLMRFVEARWEDVPRKVKHDFISACILVSEFELTLCDESSEVDACFDFFRTLKRGIHEERVGK